MSWRYPLPALCDYGASAIVLGLLIVPAIGAGGVADWGRPTIQIAAAVLGLIWSARSLLQPPPMRRGLRLPTSAAWAVALVVLLVVPLLALPPAALRIASPHAFHLFSQGLPGWPEARPFSAIATGSRPPVGSWRAMAVVPAATAATLWVGFAYALVGGAVAFYPWRDGGRPMLWRLASALIVLGVGEAVYAVLQQAEGLHRVLWFECLPGTSCIGTYVNRNHFAGLLEMILPLALARMGWRLSRRRGIEAQSAPGGWRAWLRQWADPRLGRAMVPGAAALMILMGLAISSSRSAFVVTIASLAVMSLLRPHGKYPAGPMRVRGVSLALVLVAAIWLTFPQLRARFSLEDPTRVALAADAVSMAKDFPLFGVGLGNFDAVYPAYRSRTVGMWGFPIDHAHNDYLEWLSEVGLPGALLTLALLYGLGARAVRQLVLAPGATRDAWLLWGLATGALALLLHSLTDFNLHIPANALVFAALLGGILRLTRPAAMPATARAGRRERGRGDTRVRGAAHGRAAAAAGALRGGERSAAGRVPRLLPAMAVAVCIGWAALAWVQWQAEAAFRQVYPDTPLRDLTSSPPALSSAEALRLARSAAAWAPALSYVQAGVGRLLLRDADGSDARARLDAAVGAFERSLEDAPAQPATLLDLAVAVEAKGDGGTASLAMLDDLVRRAAALAPYDPEVRLRVADWYVRRWSDLSADQRRRAAGQVESALALAARASVVASHRRRTLAAYERVHDGDRESGEAARVKLSRPAEGVD